MSPNSTSNQRHVVAELAVPPPGDMMVISIVCLTAVAFLGIAAYNLWHIHTTSTTGIVASILWVTLVAAGLLLFLLNGQGIRRTFVSCLSDFSSRHFVQALSCDGEVTICLGYRLLGREFHAQRIDRDAIVSLDWRTGQATAMTGRDMDDWHVALWYDPPAGARSPPIPGGRDEELVIVGPQRARPETESLGRSLVELLGSVGVELVPGENATEFVAKSRRA